jgi:hypothetical protein
MEGWALVQSGMGLVASEAGHLPGRGGRKTDIFHLWGWKELGREVYTE